MEPNQVNIQETTESVSHTAGKNDVVSNNLILQLTDDYSTIRDEFENTIKPKEKDLGGKSSDLLDTSRKQDRHLSKSDQKLTDRATGSGRKPADERRSRSPLRYRRIYHRSRRYSSSSSDSTSSSSSRSRNSPYRRRRSRSRSRSSSSYRHHSRSRTSYRRRSRSHSRSSPARRYRDQHDRWTNRASKPQKQMLSSVVTIPESIEQEKLRQEALEVQKEDQKGLARNKRMFGMILGTLQKFQNEESSRSEVLEKRSRIDQKVEAATRIPDEVQRELDKPPEEKEVAVSECCEKPQHYSWEDTQRCMTNFIQTQSKPQIFWSPRRHTQETQSLNQMTRDRIEEEIKERHKVLLASAEQTATD